MFEHDDVGVGGAFLPSVFKATEDGKCFYIDFDGAVVEDSAADGDADADGEEIDPDSKQ